MLMHLINLPVSTRKNQLNGFIRFIGLIKHTMLTEFIKYYKQLKNVGFICLVWFIGALSLVVKGQAITIDRCQELARENYPAMARYGIIEKTKEYTIANANRAYLPQGSFNAQASWQSDVTKINLDLPEGMPPIEVPVPDKDQYRVVAELNQLIWDGGQIAARKKELKAGAQLELQQLETEVYGLRERVNNVFFGILLMKANLHQQGTLESELQRNLDKVTAYLENGLANEADVSTVKVEQLKAKQQRVQLESALEAYVHVLSVLTGEPMDTGMTFVKPEPGTEATLQTLLQATSLPTNRPEWALFQAQENAIDSKRSLLNARSRPVIGAFAQGGYGKPGLNMFENEFAPYFVGGIRLTWNFSSLYTRKNDLRMINLQKEAVNAQRETFLYQLDMDIPRQRVEMERYRKTMEEDDEIIQHHRIMREAAEAKVENGTLTMSDLMKELLAEEAATQAKTLHEIQYLMSLYALKNTINME